jgi:hypothetical protein
MNRYWWAVPALVLGFSVIAGSVLAGVSGALIALSFAAAVPLVVLELSLGAASRRPALPDRATPRDGWHSFRSISRELGWAKVSKRHFDSAPRRMLQRVAAAALDSRAGIDFYADRDRDRAMELIGADLWPLLDPRREPSADTNAPGLDPATIDRLLTRLEQL